MSANYSIELEKILKKPDTKGKRLVLHSCCAPCSSYVLEYLRQYFRITVFYFNPNITEDSEYAKRVEEQKRLIEEFNRQPQRKYLTDAEKDQEKEDGQDTFMAYPIEVIEGSCEKERFFTAVKGLEQCPEGGERCMVCFRLRLEETAKLGKELRADYFTTTLTISPLKNAQKLNEIGQELSALYEIPFLPSDFKKKNGYQRSTKLSAEYGLYRQDYCGCIYSKRERERQDLLKPG